MSGRSATRILARAGGTLLLLLVLFWAAYSATWVVNQDQQGVVLTFGRVTRVVNAGINFTLPWPFETMERVAISTVRPMPVGYRLADRQQNIPPTEEEVQWLSGDTNIVELQGTVLYTVKDPVEYLFGTVDVEAPPGRMTIAGRKMNFIVRKVTEAVLSRLIATVPIDEVLTTGKARLQILAVPEVQAELDALDAGVHVSGINIIEVNPPSEVIRFFNDVATARQDKERKIREAEGYANRIKPTARAQANQLDQSAEVYRAELLDRANAAARNFLKLQEEVARAPDIARRRLWLDAVERILAKGRTIVVQPATGDDRVIVYLQDPARQER